MCGIVGIVSTQAVANPMMGALKRLEYRGYNSAGIATLESGRLSQRRAPGKLCNLERMLRRQPLGGNIGIGHTRWATHGKPNELNAHPHRGKYSALVHNGIIENFHELRDELTSRGHLFRSETDSEAVVHLIDLEIENGRPPFEAVRAAMSRLKGAYALAFLFEGEEDLLIAARRNSPLAVGFGKSGMYVGSDAIALAPFTDEISYLDDGDVAVLSRNAIRIFDDNGTEVHRTTTRTSVSNLLIEKGTYRHFMSKEIAEQPDVVLQTLSRYVDLATERLRPLDFPFDCTQINRISISGCGTAYYAGMIGKYWLEIQSASGRYRVRVRAPLPGTSEFPRQLISFRFSVRGNGRYARFAALCQTIGPTRCFGCKRSLVQHRARKRLGNSHLCRPRNRGRVDQGLHLPAYGNRCAIDNSRATQRSSF